MYVHVAVVYDAYTSHFEQSAVSVKFSYFESVKLNSCGMHVKSVTIVWCDISLICV